MRANGQKKGLGNLDIAKDSQVQLTLNSGSPKSHPLSPQASTNWCTFIASPESCI